MAVPIEVTGTHNESARESWVWVDSFDITESEYVPVPVPIRGDGQRR